jgi:hypothetical protein
MPATNVLSSCCDGFESPPPSDAVNILAVETGYGPACEAARPPTVQYNGDGTIALVAHGSPGNSPRVVMIIHKILEAH